MRFRIRHLMAIVALVAFGCFITRLRGRWQYYEQLARMHEAKELLCLEKVDHYKITAQIMDQIALPGARTSHVAGKAADQDTRSLPLPAQAAASDAAFHRKMSDYYRSRLW
jgi:hypothetical protein